MKSPTADMPVGRWIILDGYLKKYPATRHIHYGVVAGIRWHAEQKLAATAIEKITLRVYGEAIAYCGNRAPTAQIAAQFSLTYGLAWALVYGELSSNAYDQAGLDDPEVRRIEAMIEVVEDARLTAAEQRGCTLEVAAAGKVWSHTVTNVPGDRETPMTQDEIIEKFFALAEPVIERRAAGALIDHILRAPLDTPLTLTAPRQ
jgi:2-methylcitrate dehydratase PrpD